MGWKIGGVVLLVPAGVAALVAATMEAEYKTGMEWPIAVLFLTLAAVCFWRGAKVGARKKADRRAVDVARMKEADLEQIAAGGLPVLTEVPVILAEGEVAHFSAPARRYITKKKAIGRTGSGGGISVRVAKGVSLRSGGGASQTVYDDVTDSFGGLVTLTNRRIVFTAVQNSFDCKLASISAIAPDGDLIAVQAGQKVYRLSVVDQGYFARALGMVAGK